MQSATIQATDLMGDPRRAKPLLVGGSLLLAFAISLFVSSKLSGLAGRAPVQGSAELAIVNAHQTAR